MSISINGFNSKNVTMAASGTVEKGVPVKMASNLTVAAADDDDVFVGRAICVEDGLIGTQLVGYAVFPYSGTAPTVGIGKLSADGEGGVKADDVNGRDYLITDVDTTAKTVGIIL